jgi:hypothetical protein
MTTAQEKVIAANEYRGIDIWSEVFDCCEIDLENSNDNDVVAYDDGSALILEGGKWVAHEEMPMLG